MQDSSDKTPARPRDLLRQCQNILTKGLLGQVTPVFDSTREALFSMAEKAGSTQLQNRMLEGARQLRNQQTVFTSELSEAVAEQFTDFQDGASEFHVSEPEPVTDYKDDDLQLIEEHELEESLAISDLVSKAEVRYTQSIYALNQRLAVLNRGKPVRSDTNPCGPMKIAQTLKQAGHGIDLAPEHRVILFRRFDDNLLEELASIYQSLNDLLADAGILPNIRFATPQRRKTDQPGPGNEQDDKSNEDFFGRAIDQVKAGEPSASEPSARATSQLLSSLRGLLDARQPPAPPTPQSIAPAEQIQEVISQLQQRHATQPAAPKTAPAYNADQLRALLEQQLGQDPGTGQNYKLSHRHNQTVDIVGMLYDFIQQEIALHRRVQELLGKLQMPMLQVAMRDEQFFEDTNHPARKFFNTIADAGELWMEDEGERSPTLQKIEKIIERAATEPQGDGEKFGELLGDVSKHVQSLNRRAQLTERRHIEAARGRERLEMARTRASKLIDELTRRYQPPALVESLLTEAWTDYLALVVLRYGDESEQWNDGVKAAKTLTVSVRSDLEETLRAKIHERLPWLREHLRVGLAQVGYFDSDINQIIGDLEACQGWALTEQVTQRPERPPEALLRRAPSNKKSQQEATPAVTQPRVRKEQPAPGPVETPPETPAEKAAATPVETPAETPTERPTDSPAASNDVAGAAPPAPATSEPSPAPVAATPEPQPEPATSHGPAGASKIEKMLTDAAGAVSSGQAAPDTQPDPVAPLTEEDLNPKERSWLAKLRIVPFGTWFEIQKSDDRWVKRKLSWYSPVTGRCLFVNNRGARAEDILMEALARDMANNRARLYRPHSKPLMDRALEWMFAKLRRGEKQTVTT